MKLYTKKGDGGNTSLMNGLSISKSDDRIELLGTIDELSSHIGLTKVVSGQTLKNRLSQIQKELIQMMAGIADPKNQNYRFTQNQISVLEEEIDILENGFPRSKEFVLYGGCEQSARLDVARSVARRAERRFCKASRYYGADSKALQYMNRLSDYLYIAARYADYKTSIEPEAPEKDNYQEVIKEVIRQLEKNS